MPVVPHELLNPFITKPLDGIEIRESVLLVKRLVGPEEVQNHPENLTPAEALAGGTGFKQLGVDVVLQRLVRLANHGGQH
eukprot:11156347-Lingulodinium_polyedra.AAC.1